ncbi:uncharacterized protein ATC70_001918 [Mucor velutinosus]|uniref:Uncharacterized protein n=1 Tax=Mucor velutinosus TaxID=708070 RepID=A0AAN7HZK6_9FUNG|nr:hypothetical protein ATC70_001918 [Mucor velutinosus]
MLSCLAKLTVWQQVHNKYLGAETSIIPLGLHHLLATVRSPYVRTTSDLRIIATTLESISLSHWSFIFNDMPFTTDTVFALVAQKMCQHKQESFMATGIPHLPPPFFFVDPI